MSDDFKCHHPKNSTSTVCYHHDGIEYCSEKCFHECIARKAEHNREAAKHDSHHVGPHQNPNHDHHTHGPSDHGNIITDLNPRYPIILIQSIIIHIKSFLFLSKSFLFKSS